MPGTQTLLSVSRPRTYAVSISPTDKTGRRLTGGLAIGSDIEEHPQMSGNGFCQDIKDLLRQVQPFCQPGLSVLVRPNFNDTDGTGAYCGYREYRSINGARLAQVRFYQESLIEPGMWVNALARLPGSKDSVEIVGKVKQVVDLVGVQIVSQGQTVGAWRSACRRI